MTWYNTLLVQRVQKVLQYELPLDVKRDSSGAYVAKCTVWKDCYSQGETIDEAVLEVTAVAQSLVELHIEEGLKIPLLAA